MTTAYLIMADASILEDEAAPFTRAITETVQFQSGVCWVFQRDQSRVRLIAVGYGVPRSRPASTTQRVVRVTRLERIEEPIDLEGLLAAAGERDRREFVRWWVEPLERLRSGGVDHAEALDSNAAIILRSVFRRLSPDLAEVLERIERGQERVKVGGAAAAIWRLERDAISLALQAAGIPTARLGSWEPPDHADKPFSAGLIEPSASHGEDDRHDGGLTPAAAEAMEEQGDGRGAPPGLSLADLTRPLESSMIENDARQFPGWDHAPSGIRFDIQTFVSDNGRHMEIISVNASPAESRTGADLLYLRRDLQSLVGVQYSC